MKLRVVPILCLAASCNAFSSTPATIHALVNVRGRQAMSLRGGSSSIKMGVGPGSTIPKGLSLTWRNTEATPAKTETVTSEQLFAGKRSVIFAVPGAFTPTCSEKHLPSFVSLRKELKAAGAEVVACISVNDPFVMREWGLLYKAQESDVLMLADGNGAFSEAIGQLTDKGAAMGKRSDRYAMVLDNQMRVEVLLKESGGYGNTSAENVLKYLKNEDYSK